MLKHGVETVRRNRTGPRPNMNTPRAFSNTFEMTVFCRLRRGLVLRERILLKIQEFPLLKGISGIQLLARFYHFHMPTHSMNMKLVTFFGPLGCRSLCRANCAEEEAGEEEEDEEERGGRRRMRRRKRRAAKRWADATAEAHMIAGKGPSQALRSSVKNTFCKGD